MAGNSHDPGFRLLPRWTERSLRSESAGHQQPALPTCVCPQCGYDLRAIPESRCPECGFGFQLAAVAQISSWDSAYGIFAYRRMTVCNLLAIILAVPELVAPLGVSAADRCALLTVLLFVFLLLRPRVGNGPLSWVTDHLTLRILAALAVLPCAVMLTFVPKLAISMAFAAVLFALLTWAFMMRCHPYAADNLSPAERSTYDRCQLGAIASLGGAAVLLILSS